MSETKNVDRRAFIKGSAAATAALGALALAGCQENKLKEDESLPATGPGDAFVANEEGAEWTAAPCWHNCGGRCVNKVLVKDGVVLRQKTDDSHEDSYDWPQARGCIRGRSAQQKVFGPDRLKYPMKRKHWEPLTGGDKSLRGKDEWVRISWDEALDAIANELKNAKEKYGNRSILYGNVINAEGYLGGVLSAFGGYTDTYCTDSRGVFDYYPHLFGLKASTANDRYGTIGADYLVLWGNNPAWGAFGNPSFYLKKFKELGTKFIFVGPDYNVTAGFLNAEWIPARPGADTALLLGVAHSMITRDENGSLIDWDFLNRCTVGFDAEHMPADAKSSENYRDYVMGVYDGVEKTPEWASKICGTPVELIHRLADVLGCKNNTVMLCNGGPARCKGAENFPQGFMTVTALGGHFGKRGNGGGTSDFSYSSLNRGPNIVQPSLGGTPWQLSTADNPVDDVIPGDQLWDAVLTGSYTNSGNLSAAIHPGEPREIDIHVIVSDHHNRLQTLMDTIKGIEAYRKVDFVVAQGYTLKTDAVYADIVLPICTRWEYNKDAFYDLTMDRENSFSHVKVCDPLFEAKTDWEVAAALSERLGVNWNEIMPLSDQQLWMNAMVGTVVMNEQGEYEPLLTITQEDLDRYEVEGAPQEGRVPLEQYLADGVYRVPRSEGDAFEHIALKAFREDPEANPLETSASGKLEIYCQAKADLFTMINAGVDYYVDPSPLPKYLPQHEGYEDSFVDWEGGKQGAYPIQLTHAHYLRRAHTDCDSLPWTREAMVNPVFVNKDDARARGIEDGDVILVHNDAGSFVRPATVSRCVMPGVMVIPHGAQVRIDEETGVDMAGADNVLTRGTDSTSYGLGGWNTTLVDYEKYDGPIELKADVDWEPLVPIADGE